MRGKGIEFYMKLQNEMRKERSNLMEVVRKEGLMGNGNARKKIPPMCLQSCADVS